jgi:PPM family protein phosphatase
MTRLRAAAATDPGKVRTSNQDLALVEGDLVVVADGMGGHAGGEVAARTAIEAIASTLGVRPSLEALREAAAIANRRVFDRAERDQALRGMGTTLTAAALVEQQPGAADAPRLALVNVGDSRAYLFVDGTLERLTEDHSLVEEMVRRGEITAEAALTHPHRHILTRALGIDPGVEIDSWLLNPPIGSRILLCSDGLTNECSDEEIAATLSANPEPDAAAHALVERALEHGGADNVTVVVALVEEGGSQTDAATEARHAPVEAGPLPVTARSNARSGSTGEMRAVSSMSRAQLRQAQTTRARAPRPKEPIVTVRVVMFVLVLIAMLGGILGFVVWFDRATYFVGVNDGSVAIFEGRPGGFLWFHPSVVQQSTLPVSSVLGANLPLLEQGVLESSYDDARRVVARLANERSLLGLPSTTTTTTTAPAASATGASGPSGRH